MDKPDLNVMRRRLQEMRTAMEARAHEVEASSEVVELDQARQGRLSRMDAMQGQAMSKASGRRIEQTLGRIDAALSRIEDDDFGFCSGCGESIDPRRLDFDPTVLLCIGCAERQES